MVEFKLIFDEHDTCPEFEFEVNGVLGRIERGFENNTTVWRAFVEGELWLAEAYDFGLLLADIDARIKGN
jgi:hypothetical protein